MTRETVDPTEVSARLRQIASYVSRSGRPSVSFVRESLAAVLVATDRSFSDTIASVFADKIAKLMQSFFDGSKYDTSDRGKGFKDGYVSWGMRPIPWQGANLIGGILFSCKYDPEEFQSESPDEGGDWEGHSKGEAALTMNVSAGYYNKKLGGGVKDPVDLGTFTVLLDNKEQVVEATIDNEAELKAELTELVQQILKSPPDEALGAQNRRENMAPNTTERALMGWLNRQRRQDVKRSEIEAVVKHEVETSGSGAETVRQRVEQFFKKRGLAIDERN